VLVDKYREGIYAYAYAELRDFQDAQDVTQEVFLQLDDSVREALDSLPDAYREVLVLHYFGGMTIKNMARAMGVSPGAIGMRLSRARAQLREEMVDIMDTAFEGQRLPVGFTFRIVEAVKRIKIHPTPRMAGLPWAFRWL
jgi:DNA-directed RNA polymerase specialized sigma24 family protein